MNHEMRNRHAHRLCANIERARKLHEELLHITEILADIAQLLLLMLEAESDEAPPKQDDDRLESGGP